MIDSTYWTGKPLVADITKNSTPFLTNIDVWDYSANHTPISLSFNPGDSYSMTISSVPEPGTIAMLSGLGLVGAAAYFVRRKRQKQQA